MSNLDFISVLKVNRDLVWPLIEEKLPSLTNFPSCCTPSQKYQPLLNFHQEIVSLYPKRKGKYLRPTLLLLTAQAMGVSLDKALNTAAAMQVSEDWILIHDDIEDDSLSRRSAPAIHKIYGKEISINAGDSLHVLMWDLINGNHSILGHEKALTISQEFTHILNRTVLGQTAEILWTQQNRLDLSLQDILFILESKTAYYTIAGPMRLGAILASATQDQLEKLYQFGKYLGYSFQIRDDLLDLTSDFAGHKKQLGNDIVEGKITVLLHHLLKTASSQDKAKIVSIYSKDRSQKTPSDINFVIKKMADYQSFDYAQSLVKDYAQKALDFFDKELDFLSQQPYRSQIRSCISFLVNRDH